jgi:hypothetical protein
MTITFEPPVIAGTPLDDARAQLRQATTILGYDNGLYEMLATPRREVTVSIPLRRDDGEIELVLGHRVQHNFSRGPAKGGLRYSPDVTLDEVRALAMWMVLAIAVRGGDLGDQPEGCLVLIDTDRAVIDIVGCQHRVVVRYRFSVEIVRVEIDRKAAVWRIRRSTPYAATAVFKTVVDHHHGPEWPASLSGCQFR